MNNLQIDTACFIELIMLDLSLAPGPIVFHLPDTPFSPSFVLLCRRLNNNKKGP